MGGIGSGRHFHYSTRPYTDDYLDLDIRVMNQRGWLNKTGYQSLSWKRNGKEIGSVQLAVRMLVQFPNEKPNINLTYRSRTSGGDWQDLDYNIGLDTTKCNFGGKRYWFKCPSCNKRAGVLYGGTIFKCRKCHGLVHKSRNETTLDQAIRRLNKGKEKLEPNKHLGFNDSIEWLGKPKWMRYKTFERERKKLIFLENRVNHLMFDRLNSYLGEFKSGKT